MSAHTDYVLLSLKHDALITLAGSDQAIGMAMLCLVADKNSSYEFAVRVATRLSP